MIWRILSHFVNKKFHFFALLSTLLNLAGKKVIQGQFSSIFCNVGSHKNRYPKIRNLLYISGFVCVENRI